MKPLALVAVAAGTLIVMLVPFGAIPPIWLAAAVAGLALWRSPALRAWLGGVWSGRLDRMSALIALATVLVAGVALAVWAALQPTTVEVGSETTLDRVVDQVEQIPLWLFPLAAIVFAAVNAVAEELVYRGIVFRLLLPFGAAAAVALQAVAFGAIHLNGFPSGWWGVAMATLYGAALGWLRLRTRGLVTPIAVHFAADVVIAYLVRFGYG